MQANFYYKRNSHNEAEALSKQFEMAQAAASRNNASKDIDQTAKSNK